MNTDQFCERLCSTYRLPRNKGNDYLHIHVNPSSTPFVLLRRLSSKNSNPNDRVAYRLDVSVGVYYFDWSKDLAYGIIREWFYKVITHIQIVDKDLYKVYYIKQGRGYQLNLASTYVFYDGYRIASDDNLEKLKLRIVPIDKVPFGFFDNAHTDTILKDFGDYLITLEMAKKADYCEGGIKNFQNRFHLHHVKYITLRQLAPMLVDYDFQGWYRIRELACQAWRFSKKDK